MPTNVKGCKRSASFEDRDVLHEKETLGSQVECPDVFNLLDVSLVSCVEQESPIGSLGCESRVNDLKLLEILTDVVEVNTVLHDWITIDPECLKVDQLLNKS